MNINSNRWVLSLCVLFLFKPVVCVAGPQEVRRGLVPVDAIQSERRTPKRLALCIGINHYECKEYSALEFAVADAKSMAARLGELGYEVTSMTDDAPDAARVPTRQNLERQLEAFCVKADSEDDTILISYGGHGDQVAGRFGLIPLDYGQGASRTQMMVTLDHVGEFLNQKQCRARKRLIILDACRSANKQVAIINPFPNMDLCVISGSRDNESSYEDPILGHGRLTAAILNGLEGAAWGKNEQFLMASQLFEYVRSEFEAKGWDKNQHPREFNDTGGHLDIAWRPPPQSPGPSKADQKMYEFSLRFANDAWTQRDFVSTVDFATVALKLNEGRAEALALRSRAYHALGLIAPELADINAVIGAKNVATRTRLDFLFKRAAIQTLQNDPQTGDVLKESRLKQIADYSEVISSPETPPDLLARALLFRGTAYGDMNEREMEISDYERLISLRDAPGDLSNGAQELLDIARNELKKAQASSTSSGLGK